MCSADATSNPWHRIIQKRGRKRARILAEIGKVVAVHGSNITISTNRIQPKNPNAELFLITLPASSKQSIDTAVQNIGGFVEYASVGGRLVIKSCPAGPLEESKPDGETPTIKN